MFLQLSLFPPQASTNAAEVDLIYVMMVLLCGAVAFAVIAAMIYMGIKYRRTPENLVGADIHGSTALEIVWSIIPFFIVMGIFAWGTSLYFKLEIPPANSMEIFVTGKQWMWKIQHMNGRREINNLHVPIGRPVKLTMASEDVIHSFYVPAFRVKADVVPGRYATMWFEATQTGTFHLFCAEYCGTEHSRMIGSVTVMDAADYEAWLTTGNPSPVEIAAGTAGPASGSAGGASVVQGAAGAAASPVQAGAALFQEKACATCHITTPGGIGPILVGVPGSEVELASGDKVLADDAYLRESILTPLAKVVKGYPPAMPTFGGQLTEEQVMSLIAYIKSLGTSQSAQAHQ
ncbi:MAG TPA: cytochrome c oxidase subunit II [Candidatus Limnocylindrales bacterium]|nr:cytochrome c oxidase subunit II [Candidatus Limnocylindrales bacterium]